MTPVSAMGDPKPAVSEGHRPAHSRPAIPTREYEPGSGDSHDHAPARRPHPPRPPPPAAGPRAASPGSTPRGQPSAPRHTAPPGHSPPQQMVTVSAKVDRPFHMSKEAESGRVSSGSAGGGAGGGRE